MPADLLIAGIPRSGTTLVCQLLHSLPDVCSLVEPMDVRGLADRHEAVRAIEEFLLEARQGLLIHGRATTVHAGGRLTDNMFGTDRNVNHLRPRCVQHGTINVDKALSEDFTLVVKHPAMFTALLDLLAQHHRCAVVRNPLAVLASWNTVDASMQLGRAPVAERLDPTLRRRLDACDGPHARQLVLLSWYFERLLTLERWRVVRYEDVILTRGRTLARVVERAASLDATLKSQNRNQAYCRRLMEQIAERMYNRDGAWWEFYTRAEVAALVEGI